MIWCFGQFLVNEISTMWSFSLCQLYFMLIIATSHPGCTLGKWELIFISKLTHEKKCEQVYEPEADIRGEGGGRKVGKDPEGRIDPEGERQERWRQTARGGSSSSLLATLFLTFHQSQNICFSVYLIPWFLSPCSEVDPGPWGVELSSVGGLLSRIPSQGSQAWRLRAKL